MALLSPGWNIKLVISVIVRERKLYERNPYDKKKKDHPFHLSWGTG